MSTPQPTQQPQALRTGTPVDYTKVLSLGAIWGSAFMLMAIGLTAFHPFAISSVRILIGAVSLSLIGMLMGERWPRGWKVWGWLTVIGFFNTAAPFSLITWSEQGVAASRAAILMATVPFATMLLSHFTTTDDRFSSYKLFGLTLGVSGVILIVGTDALSAEGQPVPGQLAIMAASVCYAISNILTRKISYLPPILGNAAFMLTAQVYMLPLLILYWLPGVYPTDWKPYAALLALGLGPTAIAYVVRFQVIRDVGSTFLSQVGYLVPVFGVIWAWLVLGEIPEPTAFAAFALILLGIRVTQGPRKRSKLAAEATPTRP